MTKILEPTTRSRETKIRPQIFIGFDERQSLAYEVCKKSIEESASGPVDIYPLNHRDLRRKGLFNRPWVVNPETGNYIDGLDDIPFSNQFSHIRFLVPEYALFLGIREPMALFVDLDFVFFDDIYSLFQICNDADNPVSCVKHEYVPTWEKKMDNQIQTQYPKKLWSSFIMFKLDDLRNRQRLSQEYVNTATSIALHRFEWMPEEEIGSIPESWNFIPGHSEDRVDRISAIHYTEGLPDFPGFETSKYSRYYLDLRRKVLK